MEDVSKNIWWANQENIGWSRYLEETKVHIFTPYTSVYFPFIFEGLPLIVKSSLLK